VFCSGHDFADFSGRTEEQQREVLAACAEVNMLLERVPQTTLAAVNGLATAGGCQLVASCDLVFASSSGGRFCLPGARSGGFCHTPAVGLGGRVSPRKVFELAMLADEVDAAEAERIGLCNKAVAGGREELEKEVDAVARRLCQRFGPQMAIGKQVLYRQLRASSPEEKYSIATSAMVDMFNSTAYAKTMREFLEKKDKKPARL
ncbi:unnamed protein product, partial [Polarella glacialis]